MSAFSASIVALRVAIEALTGSVAAVGAVMFCLGRYLPTGDGSFEPSLMYVSRPFILKTSSER